MKKTILIAMLLLSPACGGPDKTGRIVCDADTATDCHAHDPAGFACARCEPVDMMFDSCLLDGVTYPDRSDIKAGIQYVCYHDCTTQCAP